VDGRDAEGGKKVVVRRKSVFKRIFRVGAKGE
jgi:hypothetical protein